MRCLRMTVRNRIKELVDGMSKTRYQFWKETKLAQNTAYRLYDDPDYIPGPTVMDKICKTYLGVQPGDFIVYIPDDELPATVTGSDSPKELEQRKEPDVHDYPRETKRTRSFITIVSGVPESA
ncbi:MAG: helix-turn-helix transcriptional regulator [Gloeocapsa sp. UFS-A4-WI-NPMV-4B04]|nr:helix-turn-helix transcriptional regulator [Gloeocapsa sp. UFS-A4-WI-NPMV-4B04]